ncbi:sugar porter family MFS transporter [Actinomadura flavalba]|uniref:sugar porter family MFS transporter n=1 Tax=Actinomadura flavalba TaxID=1120938 RepID=UPI00037725E8|nr:sugar porter family MFS transporter [Actinomadura flavalba]
MQAYNTAPSQHGPLAEVPPEGRRKIWRWAVLIAVGGFLFGFDTGVISGALLFIKKDFGLSSFEQGAVVSVLVLGAMVGALASGRLLDRIGRRKALGIEGAVFLVGTAIAVVAPGFVTLLLARLVLGLAVGAASATVPVYLSEIAPKEIRGRVLTLNQLLITVGILVAYVTNLIFSGAGDWRAMIGVGAVPALVMVAASLWFVPESAAWQLSRGRTAEARRGIASVTNDATADVLIRRYEDNQAKEAKEHGPEQKSRSLLSPAVRPALIVGVLLAAIQQFGGINTIIYFAPTIIEQTGLTASNAIFYSIAIGVINFVMTVVATRFIDRAGRRPLLLFSLAGMAVSMALLGLSFVAGWPSVLTLVFMVLFIAVYAVGLGPVFWAIIGEIFPPRARGAGSSAATATNWASNFAVSLLFLPLMQLIGEGETFWIFAAISLAGLFFVARFVPETKGRDQREVDADLQSRFGHATT